jgi:hypothetical protein
MKLFFITQAVCCAVLMTVMLFYEQLDFAGAAFISYILSVGFAFIGAEFDKRGIE